MILPPLIRICHGKVKYWSAKNHQFIADNNSEFSLRASLKQTQDPQQSVWRVFDQTMHSRIELHEHLNMLGREKTQVQIVRFFYVCFLLCRCFFFLE